MHRRRQSEVELLIRVDQRAVVVARRAGLRHRHPASPVARAHRVVARQRRLIVHVAVHGDVVGRVALSIVRIDHDHDVRRRRRRWRWRRRRRRRQTADLVRTATHRVQRRLRVAPVVVRVVAAHRHVVRAEIRWVVIAVLPHPHVRRVGAAPASARHHELFLRAQTRAVLRAAVLGLLPRRAQKAPAHARRRASAELSACIDRPAQLGARQCRPPLPRQWRR